MNGVNVGSVFFDMKYNQGAFNKSVNQGANKLQGTFGSAFGKIGKMAAAAFGVAAITKFMKSAIDLGSDLTEVQNVVDVTFGDGAKVIDKFAVSSMTAFGLSELSAKQYTGTMGAMLKSMGLTTNVAQDMSIEMAKLAGDIASFYNLDTDEAFTKIRSGISGETEPLKQLGINMSVANMEAYALTQGITKAYSAMTQSEQALLRYNYLMSVTADAQGDFSRNAGTWANQIRILQLQWDSFKSSMGQAFIAVLTPVLRGLNTLMGYLVAAGNTFKSFIALITGTEQQASSMGQSAANSVAGVGAAAEQAGSDAAKGAKKAKGALAAFDELNNLTQNDASGSGGGGGGAGGDAPASIDFGEAQTQGSVLDSIFSGLIKKGKELFTLFKDGFSKGLGADFSASLGRITDHMRNIKTNIIDIFTDPSVLGAADFMVDRIAYNLGKTAGSLVSVGTSIAENVIGGIDLYLSQNSGWIKKRLVSMFNVTGDIATIVGNLSASVGVIFEAFRGEKAKQFRADLIGVFTNAGLGLGDIGRRFGRDFIDAISMPIVQNSEQIKEALENTFAPLSTIFSTLNNSVKSTFDKIFEVYDAKIKPAITGIGTAWSSMVNSVVGAYNKHVAPVLQQLADKFTEVWQSHIQPMLSKFVSFIGTVANAISQFYQNVLAPVINWIIQTIVPIVIPIIEAIWNKVMGAIRMIGTVLGGLWDMLSGFIDFIVNIFSGNWAGAWEGIKQMFSGFVTIIMGLVGGLWDGIVSTFQIAFATLGAVAQTAWEYIKGIFVAVGETIKNVVITLWTGIKTTLGNIVNGIRDTFVSVFTGMKSAVVNIFTGIWSGIKGVINSILGGVEGMANGVVGGINKVVESLNTLKFDIPDWVPGLGGKSFGLSIPTIGPVSLPRLAKGGLVDQPTVAMIGEAGKEAVVPLENNTGWMVNLANILAEALVSKLLMAQAGSSGNSTQSPESVKLEIDGRELGEVMLDYILAAANRRGIKLQLA